ncbi:hypothetical protein SLITO_v1c09260 [Spiroplasma litorale]|uniref:Transmembrane protein n=1 Tax=Spiroplasma litorale TaxID=216942 RepID=A0A0K1W360_9MOLU|nr:hypothetical protein [Spiroplasma litorale]AKX34537.1 hypothetical protein SLITO_v1c09260 [Spiroplasma litorale]
MIDILDVSLITTILLLFILGCSYLISFITLIIFIIYHFKINSYINMKLHIIRGIFGWFNLAIIPALIIENIHILKKQKQNNTYLNDILCSKYQIDAQIYLLYLGSILKYVYAINLFIFNSWSRDQLVYLFILLYINIIISIVYVLYNMQQYNNLINNKYKKIIYLTMLFSLINLILYHIIPHKIIMNIEI